MKALVLGYGEIGKSVEEVYKDYHEVYHFDHKYQEELPNINVDVLLICYPYYERFIDDTKVYIDNYNPKAVIVFSTVPIGTTAQIFNAVHSPVEGKHPNLADSIRKMRRFIGGINVTAYEFLSDVHIDIQNLLKPEYTEFLKLQSTSNYGVMLEYARYVKSVADSIGMNYKYVKQFNKAYNNLYKSMDMNQFQRYILDAPVGNLGGHCVVPNAKLLDAQFPNLFLKEIYRNKE